VPYVETGSNRRHAWEHVPRKFCWVATMQRKVKLWILILPPIMMTSQPLLVILENCGWKVNALLRLKAAVMQLHSIQMKSFFAL